MAVKLDNLSNLANIMAKSSNEKANNKQIVWISDENLLDHPLNDEDISYTEDIEEHIKNEGFRYPLTVTKCGCTEANKYFIVDGHRSRAAGRKVGKKEFPCIVAEYASETEVYYALLSANANRNSDPLLLVKRYQKWEKYLDMIDFKGNRAEKIAVCLGISAKYAEKCKAFSKLIPEFWELVYSGAAKDGLYPVATKDEEEQRAIYNFFLNCTESEKLTVSDEKSMLNAWKQGVRTAEEYSEFINNDKMEDTPPVAKQESVMSQYANSIIHKEIDGDNEKDKVHISSEEKMKYKEERLSDEDMQVAQVVNKVDKKEPTFDELIEKSLKKAKIDMNDLTERNTFMNEAYKSMEKTFDVMYQLTIAIGLIRDANMAYEEYEELYAEFNKKVDELGLPFN